MIILTSKFTFESAHRLFLYNGDSANIHGHSYKVEISIDAEVCEESNVQTNLFNEQKEINYPGITIDFTYLKCVIGNYIKNKYDHSLLLNNEDSLKEVIGEYTDKIVYFDSNPTEEIISIKLFKEISGILLQKGINGTLQSVSLWSTEDNCAIAIIDSIIEEI